MKKISAISIILLLIAGIAYAKSYEVTKKAGEYTIAATIDNNPPVVGENGVTIEIKDASGKGVTDAKVKVEYSMPAMPGMPAMNYKTDAVLKGTGYQSKMNLSMAGSWNVTVKVLRGGKTATMKFNVDAH
ncbi:MAG: FixH family protein [Nitrospirae bacterium]|nr:FixH family protein [Nitrospirota bacterium]